MMVLALSCDIDRLSKPSDFVRNLPNLHAIIWSHDFCFFKLLYFIIKKQWDQIGNISQWSLQYLMKAGGNEYHILSFSFMATFFQAMRLSILPNFFQCFLLCQHFPKTCGFQFFSNQAMRPTRLQGSWENTVSFARIAVPCLPQILACLPKVYFQRLVVGI